ncbi:MFS transporter [Actinomycetospora cinnamomea]|uniref:Putative proline/betaine transporter n=1 Tax=Actinomycetospora cinnamomea TaxID=663609 RepID=A0A2U1FHX3_9PSEU|nr:MFS transporter [Actinomycetospora cinnamomea]PVZ11775.1 metabolite-proton symporter [Actinomycetospora cinnamomea]
MAEEAGRLDERSIRKVAAISAVGSTIEWYDFFIFGTAAALVFPDLFFPEASPTAGALLTFSVFGVAFLARPLGGVVWGHFGDRVGRKKAFLTALFTMAVGTTLIGVLPTYATIGIAAPIILTVLRFVQGLAVGGQWGGAVLLATEFAPRHRRGFYGSFAQVGVPLGVIFGQVLFIVLASQTAPETFAAWGWRVPFLVSVLLIGVAVYAQKKLEDTPAFRHLQELRAQQAEQAGTAAPQRGSSPIVEAFRRFPRQILLGAGAFIVVNATFYIYIVYILDYATEDLGLSTTTVLVAILIASIVQIAALPAFAALSDRIGRRRTYLFGALATAVWAIPFFLLIDTASPVALAIALVVAQLALSMMYGPQAAFFSEMFSAQVRYSGASLGYQIGAALGGGFSPVIATALLAATGTTMAISVYMIVLALVAVACVWALTETYQNAMEDDETVSGRPSPTSPR